VQKTKCEIKRLVYVTACSKTVTNYLPVVCKFYLTEITYIVQICQYVNIHAS